MRSASASLWFRATKRFRCNRETRWRCCRSPSSRPTCLRRCDRRPRGRRFAEDRWDRLVHGPPHGLLRGLLPRLERNPDPATDAVRIENELGRPTELMRDDLAYQAVAKPRLGRRRYLRPAAFAPLDGHVRGAAAVG